MPPEQPSEQSTKLAESLVLIEFINDLYPEAKLAPSDPVDRAKMRLFMDASTTTLAPAFLSFFKGDADSANTLIKALERIQTLLPAEGYAIGQWSLADIAAAPIMARIELCLERRLCLTAAGTVTECLAKFQSPEFARLRKYIADIHARDSFKRIWDAVSRHRYIFILLNNYSSFFRTP